MRFYIPKAGRANSILDEFEQNTRIAAHQRLVKRIIHEAVRDRQREHALTQAGGDCDSAEWHQGKLNRLDGEVSEIRGSIGEWFPKLETVSKKVSKSGQSFFEVSK
jgi:hypothetical protein